MHEKKTQFQVEARYSKERLLYKHVDSHNVHASLYHAGVDTVGTLIFPRYTVCLKNWRANYDLLLNLAQLPRLSSRRKFLKLCLLFNIFTGKVAYHDSPLVRQLSPYPNELQNSLQLSPLYARIDHFKYSFFPSSIEAWNSLHFDVASKNSWLSFKRALHN